MFGIQTSAVVWEEHLDSSIPMMNGTNFLQNETLTFTSVSPQKDKLQIRDAIYRQLNKWKYFRYDWF